MFNKRCFHYNQIYPSRVEETSREMAKASERESAHEVIYAQTGQIWPTFLMLSLFSLICQGEHEHNSFLYCPSFRYRDRTQITGVYINHNTRYIPQVSPRISQFNTQSETRFAPSSTQAITGIPLAIQYISSSTLSVIPLQDSQHNASTC